MSSIRIAKASRKWSFDRQLGAIVSVMVRRGAYAPDMAAEINNLRPAILHEQVYFFFDAYKRVCGYAAWAMLAPDVEQRIQSNQTLLLHESEWNEGGNFWIVAFGSASRRTADLIRNLKAEVLPRHGELRFLRHRMDGRRAIVRIVRQSSGTPPP